MSLHDVHVTGEIMLAAESAAQTMYSQVPQSDEPDKSADGSCRVAGRKRRQLVARSLLPIKGCLLALLSAFFFSLSNVFVRKGAGNPNYQ